MVKEAKLDIRFFLEIFWASRNAILEFCGFRGACPPQHPGAGSEGIPGYAMQPVSGLLLIYSHGDTVLSLSTENLYVILLDNTDGLVNTESYVAHAVNVGRLSPLEPTGLTENLG